MTAEAGCQPRLPRPAWSDYAVAAELQRTLAAPEGGRTWSHLPAACSRRDAARHALVRRRVPRRWLAQRSCRGGCDRYWLSTRPAGLTQRRRRAAEQEARWPPTRSRRSRLPSSGGSAFTCFSRRDHTARQAPFLKAAGAIMSTNSTRVAALAFGHRISPLPRRLAGHWSSHWSYKARSTVAFNRHPAGASRAAVAGAGRLHRAPAVAPGALASEMLWPGWRRGELAVDATTVPGWSAADWPAGRGWASAHCREE